MIDPLNEIKARIKKLPEVKQNEANEYLEKCRCLFNGGIKIGEAISQMIKLIKFFEKHGV